MKSPYAHKWVHLLFITYGILVIITAIIETLFFSFKTIEPITSPVTYRTDYTPLLWSLPYALPAFFGALLLQKKPRIGYWFALLSSGFMSIFLAVFLLMKAPRFLALLVTYSNAGLHYSLSILSSFDCTMRATPCRRDCVFNAVQPPKRQ